MRVLRSLLVVIVALFISVSAIAQTANGSLHGKVTDPSGAVVAQATVTAKSASGLAYTTTANARGEYEIKGLPAGVYTVNAVAKGFSVSELPNVNIAAGQAQMLDVALGIEVEKQQVTVEDEGANVEVSPSNNASSLVIKGKDLDALSDDPDELQSDLQALAGPSAGPNGGQIYIDGFTNGQLPPKNAIREIRVNQNPFSAQFERLGYGRIEVFTKPGLDKFHGQFQMTDNHSFFNATSPFAPVQPDYDTEMYSGNLSGPINKKASFFVNLERRNVNEASVINATIIDPTTLAPTTYQNAVLNPRTRTSFSPRVDYQLTPTNTLTARYQYNKNSEENDGIGQFSLPTQGYNSNSTAHNLQVSDTQIINSKMVNESRFQFTRDREQQAALLNGVTINVQSAFVGGGSSSGVQEAHSEHYEFQNYTSMALSKHFVKFGARVRASRLLSKSTAGYNGAYTFNNLNDYQAGRPSQFNVTFGIPVASVAYADAGLYAEDDWRLRPNVTLSYGLRYETQSGISSHFNLAPRVGVAWGIHGGKTPAKTVLRAGFGMFYDRFNEDLLLTAQRQNGVTQRSYTLNDPAILATLYPNIPTQAQLTASQPTIAKVDPGLKSPYSVQFATTLERQVTKSATASVTYLHSHGVHTLVSQNVNAPLPGTYDPATGTGVYPLGQKQIVNQYESQGRFNQNQMIANANIRSKKFTMFGFYMLNFANSNTSGASSFPSSPYDLMADYGRANFDVRHRGVIGGNISLPYRVSLSPFIISNSGSPYNIVVGRDLNGDGIFNDRPAFATATSTNVIATQWGLLDINPAPGVARIPINYGTGPLTVTMNLRVSKSFGFGKETGNAASAQRGGERGPGGPMMMGGSGGRGGEHGGGGGQMGGGGQGGTHRYNLTISASARNLLNRVNLANPVGNLNSPYVGQSIALAGGPFGGTGGAANRRVDLQMQFSF